MDKPFLPFKHSLSNPPLAFTHRLHTLLLKAGLLLAALMLPLAGFAADAYSEAAYPTINYGSDAAKAEQIKHGEYLAKAGDCIACHTTEGGKPFAGGLPVKTPFGTIYSPNITSDKETGIGKWSDDDFVRSMHEGISPKGEYFYPVFPYVFYNKLSREDVLDIRAYLEKLPAVRQENRALDMPWPFNVRLLQSFWRFMFFDAHKGQFVPDNRKSEEWNRGAYLVEGLGHCAMCHTPVNAIGGWQRQYDLTGGFVDGYYAPNISASRLKDVPVDKIVNVFLHDKGLEGGNIQGPMLQVNHDSLRYLSVDDLRAIATYIKSVDSIMPPTPDTGTGEKAGKAIYEQYCAGCHNMGGGGAPKFGDAGQWEPIVKLGMPQVYNNAIKGIAGMPAKGNCSSCTDDQVKFAVDYIVKKSTGGEASGSGPSNVDVAQTITSLPRGKQIYDQVCSVCHTQGQLGAPKLGDQTIWQPLLKQNLDILVGHAIQGYKGHPPKGACYQCSDADVISAVKYMAQQSGEGDYRLW